MFGVFLMCCWYFWCVVSVFLVCFWCVFRFFGFSAWGTAGVCLHGGNQGDLMEEPGGDLCGEPGGARHTALPLEIE